MLLTGRSEFIEKYFETVVDLQARGFSVAAMDWRGQGLSERLLPDSEKGHITDFAAYAADLRCFFDAHVRPALDGPYVLLAHSMGSTPSLQSLGAGWDAFSCAVFSAPMTRIYRSAVKRALARALAAGACRLGAARRAIPGVKEHSIEFEGNILTSDERRHERFRQLQAVAPKAIIREPTYGWVRAAFEAMDRLHRADAFRDLRTPVLIASAQEDRLVQSGDHRALARRSDLIERIEIAGALHEILMERDVFRDAFWRAFDDFVEPRLAAPSEGAAALAAR